MLYDQDLKFGLLKFFIFIHETNVIDLRTISLILVLALDMNKYWLYYFVINIWSLFICTGEIKQILESELQIPMSKMLLKGWKTGDVEDSVSFIIT